MGRRKRGREGRGGREGREGGGKKREQCSVISLASKCNHENKLLLGGLSATFIKYGVCVCNLYHLYNAVLLIPKRGTYYILFN